MFNKLKNFSLFKPYFYIFETSTKIIQLTKERKSNEKNTKI